MALFELPKVKQREFIISPEMQLVIDSGLLDESQVKKFSDFPELLSIELDNEERNPDIGNLEKDIFDAVFNNNYIKFFGCVARVGHDVNMLPRIYNWLLTKGTSEPSKEEKDLEERFSRFSELETRENKLLKLSIKRKLLEDEENELEQVKNEKEEVELTVVDRRRLNYFRGKRIFSKRDLALLKRVEGAKSVFNIFDY